jgi:hypothetical protein
MVTERTERRQEFPAEAGRRLRHMQRTGEYLTTDDRRALATALARGRKPARPEPRKTTPQEPARRRASVRRAG